MSARTHGRVLIAGIGNVFLGDDGFGVEVAGRIDPSALPPGVHVADYGIRGVHLAYDLLDGIWDTLIMVDAVPIDGPPGTLAVIDAGMDAALDDSLAEEHPGEAGRPDPFGPPAVDGHGMHPQAVLRLLRSLGGRVGRVLVVGCKPAVIDEVMGLSEPVRTAVGDAVQMVMALAAKEAARGALDAERAGA